MEQVQQPVEQNFMKQLTFKSYYYFDYFQFQLSYTTPKCKLILRFNIYNYQLSKHQISIIHELQ